jgi:hypothetical protein
MNRMSAQPRCICLGRFERRIVLVKRDGWSSGGRMSDKTLAAGRKAQKSTSSGRLVAQTRLAARTRDTPSAGGDRTTRRGAGRVLADRKQIKTMRP